MEFSSLLSDDTITEEIGRCVAVAVRVEASRVTGAQEITPQR